jgi:hypothetical protein
VQAATSEALTEFITLSVATSLKDVDARPDHVRKVAQIFRSVTGKTAAQGKLCAPERSILEKNQGLRSSRVISQMNTGTIMRSHC